MIVAMVVASLPVCQIAAKSQIAASADGDVIYHAYLGFQTDTYIFRDTWNHEYYGLNSSSLNYNSEIGYWKDNYLEKKSVSTENADIASDGSYSVSISNLNLKALDAAGFHMLYVTTDIPCSQKGVWFSDATLTIDDTVVAVYDVIPQKGDEKKYYQLMLADSNAPGDGTVDCKYDDKNMLWVLPANKIMVTFHINGLGDKSNSNELEGGNTLFPSNPSIDEDNDTSSIDIPSEDEGGNKNTILRYNVNFGDIWDCELHEDGEIIYALPNTNDKNVYIKITISDICCYNNDGTFEPEPFGRVCGVSGIANGKNEFSNVIYADENFSETMKLGSGKNKFSIKYGGDIFNNWDYFTCKIEFTKVVKKEKTISLNKKSLTMYLDNGFGILKLKNAKDNKVKWKSSNKKIAKCDRWGEVTPVHVGKCKITGIYQSKKYVCKVTVKLRKTFSMWAKLYKYDTRKNVFYMELTNYTNKKMIVLANDAVAVDSDYTTFDRSVYLLKNVVIKPGKTKKLKFHVKGSVTWYKCSDFCMNCWVKWKNKKKRIAADNEECFVRKGKKWKSM